jgi:hypothetical protein
MLPLAPLNACTAPTTTRIWSTPAAADELSRDDRDASEQRQADGARETRDPKPRVTDPPNVVLRPGEDGEEHLLQRCDDVGHRPERRLVCERVDRQRRGAQKPADENVVGRVVHIREEAGRRLAHGESSEVANARDRQGQRRAPRRDPPEQEHPARRGNELLHDERPRPSSLRGRGDRADGARRDTDERPELERAEVHCTREQRPLCRRERVQQEDRAEPEDQRPDRRVAVRRCQRAGERRREGREDGPCRDADPEGRRDVDLREHRALHDGCAEPEVGERDCEGRQHERHRGETVVARRDEVCEHDRGSQPENL